MVKARLLHWLSASSPGRNFVVMSLLLGSTIPDFAAETNEGHIPSFHQWIGESWGILFSHPADFTPVCTTELARAAELSEEFKNRNVKLIAISVDSVDTHRQWIKDIVYYSNQRCQECCKAKKLTEDQFPFPIIADEKRILIEKFGMLDPDERDKNGVPLSARVVFFIGPNKTLKSSIIYPATTGRNFHEILRVVDALQTSAKHMVATPVDWKQGEACILQPNVDKNTAEHLYPGHKTVDLPSGKNYLRITDVSEP